MDSAELKKQWREAASNNTLLTPKHDPRNLTTTFRSFRTVLSHEASSSLRSFIDSNDYNIHAYESSVPGHNPFYYKVVPTNNSHFSIPASGVTANSPTPTTIVDSLVIVSGSSGWHIFGENASNIETKVSGGIFIDKGVLP